MDKLSSILPNSPRIKSVDLSEAKPRRPGAPAFGVPVGTTASVRDRVTLSSNRLPEEAVYRNPREFKASKTADEATKKFFEKRLMSLDEMPLSTSEAVVAELGDAMVEKSSIPAAPSLPPQIQHGEVEN